MFCTTVLGVPLEVLHIAAPARPAGTPTSAADPAPAPIVFLHEGLGSVAMWQGKSGCWPAQVCAATGRSGLVYSRQGYGQSAPVTDVRGPPAVVDGLRQGRLQADYLHREAYEVLPALLAQWGIERPVLLGHSDGASIALLYASRHATAACVVMAPHLWVQDIALHAIADIRTKYLQSPALRERLARYHADADCAFWQWNDVWLSEGFRSFDIRAECACISAPVLAIQGWDDAYGTMAQIDAIKDAVETVYFRKNPGVPASKLPVVLQKLEHCGHSPHKDQAETTLRLVADFLD